jgi:hypothetical protein
MKPKSGSNKGKSVNKIQKNSAAASNKSIGADPSGKQTSPTRMKGIQPAKKTKGHNAPESAKTRKSRG